MQCSIEETNVVRPRANYHPDLWGDRFFNYTPPDTVIQGQMEQAAVVFKELVRQELLVNDKDPKERLAFLDDVHRLGVAYHFEDEIEDIFQKFYNKFYVDSCYEDDLHYVSLRFRLLRQHGFFVSCDVFENFKCEDKGFKDFLASDVQGLLNLYEASYLGVHGEKTLDEARAFATTHLTSFATQLSSPMAEQVAHALKLPLQRRSIRLESRHQISFYESKLCNNETLLKFAKLDFNLLQILHNTELRDLTRWWRSVDMEKKLPFVRHRLVEVYFWILGVYYEPKYSYARMLLNKLCKILSIVDDIYDAYGTIEELKSFTKAIQRWDKSCIDQFPSYLREMYQVILDTFQEIEQNLALEQRSFGVYLLQQQMNVTCQAYLHEAMWRHENVVPTFDEYMKNAIGSSGYLYVITASFIGMGELATKDAFESVDRTTKAQKASCILARLLNDIASHEFEKKRNHVSSAIDCYMDQFGTSIEEATRGLQAHIEEAWKDTNDEILEPKIVPKPLLLRVINLSRTLYDMYHNAEDGYTTSTFTQEKVAKVLIHPIASSYILVLCVSFTTLDFTFVLRNLPLC
ncbi:(-)-germacrene D synthase-like [Chenopodium quinoa]|uniref:(-)-germacrene D synthase-like n=1 Tax=Chenopodium quinoa TaxID=63459 RepID=UPI000B78C617|nr:(-)-germacrene D synthase-like [Chenopodium quinoa]